MEEITKQCRICKEIKPIGKFHKKKGAPDGHRNECAVCAIKIRKTYTEKESKDDINERNRKSYHKKQAEKLKLKKENPILFDELYNKTKNIDENATKKCRICHEIKPLSDFGIRNRTKDGHATECKECSKIIDKQYRDGASEDSKENKKLHNKEYNKKRYEKNKEDIKEQSKKYYNENKEDIKEKNKKTNKERYEKNKEEILEKQRKHHNENKTEINKRKRELAEKNKVKIKEQKKKYREKNKDKIKEQKKIYRQENKVKYNEYRRNKKKTDLLYKLTCSIRTLISNSIIRSGYSKKSRTYQILGCTFEEVKIHLENKFEPWMNWLNYGNPTDGLFEPNKTWDIDHITPISSAKSEEDVIKLNHYTNLQPLCSYKNRWDKRDK